MTWSSAESVVSIGSLPFVSRFFSRDNVGRWRRRRLSHGVEGDAIEPCIKLTLTLEAGQFYKGLSERFLHDIFGFGVRQSHVASW